MTYEDFSQLLESLHPYEKLRCVRETECFLWFLVLVPILVVGADDDEKIVILCALVL